MSGELSTHALCWRIERKDGAGLALTSHDQPVRVADQVYRPAPGVTPAAVRRSLAMDAKAGEATGALTSEAIAEEDLIVGRWDGAAVTLSVVDWETADATIELLSGTIGRVEQKDREFDAELLGPSARLREPVCPSTSPECRAEFGGPACRVDMAGRSVRARLSGADGLVLTLDRPVDERFLLGTVRILGGRANGVKGTILKVEADTVVLRSTPPFSLEPGVAVELTEGCDKRLSTCSTRFGNAANFRGEPHLPGNDLLTRYPGS